MGSGWDGQREKISWMCLSSVSYYGICALFKELFVSREKVAVLNYTRKHYAFCSSMSLVCFKILIKKCLKETFLRTAQCLPPLKHMSWVLFLFLSWQWLLSFDVRQGFYLCNRRCGSALRWDKLITLFSEPLNRDKRKLTPQSSLSHSCALCCALSVLYLSQHNAICKAVFNRATDIQTKNSALQNAQL